MPMHLFGHVGLSVFRIFRFLCICTIEVRHYLKIFLLHVRVPAVEHHAYKLLQHQHIFLVD